MGHWLLNLPVVWMSLVILAGTYVVAFGIYLVVSSLAVGDRVRVFKGVSSGIQGLPVSTKSGEASDPLKRIVPGSPPASV